MLYCDLCGRSIKRGYRIMLEGAVLTVCEQCSSRGEVIGEVRVLQRTRKKEAYVDIVFDFGRRIREARKRLRMDIERLAKETGIPAYKLKKIEEEKFIPTLFQVERLEKALGITLREEDDRGEWEKEKRSDFTLTLGDVVRIR